VSRSHLRSDHIASRRLKVGDMIIKHSHTPVNEPILVGVLLDGDDDACYVRVQWVDVYRGDIMTYLCDEAVHTLLRLVNDASESRFELVPC